MSSKLRAKYGYSIGFIRPDLAFVDQTSEYIINEEMVDDTSNIHLLHKSDISIERSEASIRYFMKEIPENDEKVEQFLENLNQLIYDGALWFDPGITREIDGIQVSITRRVIPGSSRILYEISSSTGINLYDYQNLKLEAMINPAIKSIVDAIDEMWPQDTKSTESQATPDIPFKTESPEAYWYKLCSSLTKKIFDTTLRIYNNIISYLVNTKNNLRRKFNDRFRSKPTIEESVKEQDITDV